MGKENRLSEREKQLSGIIEPGQIWYGGPYYLQGTTKDTDINPGTKVQVLKVEPWVFTYENKTTEHIWVTVEFLDRPGIRDCYDSRAFLKRFKSNCRPEMIMTPELVAIILDKQDLLDDASKAHDSWNPASAAMLANMFLAEIQNPK